MLYRNFKCIHSKNCTNACPHNAIKDENGSIEIKREICDTCGNCVNACNSSALEICGVYMTATEILNEVLSDKVFYDQSGGGITFSGGEPLMQFEFLKEILQKAKNHSINTCLDTTGYISGQKLNEITELVDLFLYDVKTINEQKHMRLTGKSNKLILENLNFLLDENCEILIRIPIIPEYNFMNVISELEDQIQNLYEMGLNSFELIPYHQYGIQKYKMLGKEYLLDVKRVDLTRISSLIKGFSEKKISIKVSEPILT